MSKLKIDLTQVPQEILDLPESDFEVAGSGEKLMDENFQTVARGFFKDAFFRLSKDKASVVAAIILVIIVFMSIFGPMMSPYEYTELHPEFANMPSRIPFLEDLGICNGKYTLKNRRLDSLEDPEKFPNGGVLGSTNEHEVRGVTLVEVRVNY